MYVEITFPESLRLPARPRPVTVPLREMSSGSGLKAGAPGSMHALLF